MGCLKLYDQEAGEGIGQTAFFSGGSLKKKESALKNRYNYYPFGLRFASYKKDFATENRMNTFQDQEYEEETGWVKFKWRNHQPELGRFFNVDPLAEDYYYNSPYAFSENKVVAHIELEGLESLPFMSWFNAAVSYVDYKIDQSTLSAPEKKYAKKNRLKAIAARDNKGIAEGYQKNIGFKTSVLDPYHNDESDAFRHGMWGALTTQTSGADFTRGMGEAHEEGVPNDPNESKMDLHNNEVGIQIATDNPDASPEELAKLMLGALKDGKMVVIKPFGKQDYKTVGKNIDNLYDKENGKTEDDTLYDQ